MNTNDLKIFQAVAEYGSFTKAAAITNTVQSNVSARIKYLEEYFNASLFKRSTRQIELTDAGLKVLKAAKELQLIIDKTRSAVSSTLAQPAGTIRIGCIQTAAALRVPGILSSFTARYPDMDFRLKTGTTADLTAQVLSYKLDGAFISDEVDNPLLDVKEVLVEELCIIAASTSSPILDEIIKATKPVKLIVFSKGCSYRRRLLTIMEDHFIKNFKLIEVDTLDGIINSVEAGVGITLLPLELIKRQYSYRGLLIFQPPHKLLRCPTVFIKRKDFPLSEGYDLFTESIVEGYSSLISKSLKSQ